MPNFPSIYLELQALWRNVRELQNIFSEFARRLEELERITQCMDYVTSPTNSTVFNCDVRLSGSGDPDLYVDGNITTKSNLIASGSTILGDSSSDTVTINAIANAATTASHKVITIDETTGIIKKETFANIGAGLVTGSYLFRASGGNYFNVPTNCNYVKITCIGGGGGGGSGTTDGQNNGLIGTGGGGGGYSSVVYKRVSLPDTLTVFVGAGGSSSSNGGSSFVYSGSQYYCSAAGGVGGNAVASTGDLSTNKIKGGSGMFKGAYARNLDDSETTEYYQK